MLSAGYRWWAGVDKVYYTEKCLDLETTPFYDTNPTSLSPVIAEGRGRVQAVLGAE